MCVQLMNKIETQMFEFLPQVIKIEVKKQLGKR
jgi:hypothetical protein